MISKRSWRVPALLVLLTLAAPRPAPAQSGAADSLLQHGGLERAESLYYSAARIRPRDPMSRWKLGRYLAERGAPRVGATLMEEAIQFGGPTWAQLVSPDLARLYEQLGEYRSLAELSTAPLSSAERNRADWLGAHPRQLTMPDSEVLVAYVAGPSPRYLGRMPIRIDGKTLTAAISATARGITISDTSGVVGRLHVFGAPAGARKGADHAQPAAADSVAFGRVALTNVAVDVEEIASTKDASVDAIVGLDVLSQFSPTFDPREQRITLRSGRAGAASQHGSQHATRLTASDFLILRAGGWASASALPISKMLAGQRWTFDAKRGQIFVEP